MFVLGHASFFFFLSNVIHSAKVMLCVMLLYAFGYHRCIVVMWAVCGFPESFCEVGTFEILFVGC